jgi:hypothetical protein
MTAAAALPGPAPYVEEHERKVYKSGTGRKMFFSFAFLVLLPFFLSLPGMLYMRLKHGHIEDSIGLAVFATFFGILMFLLLIELLLSVRARVELGADRIKLTLPSGRGPTPMLFYTSTEVPYDQVQTVETRREIYGGLFLPVILKGARLTLKDGSHVRLGYVSEACVDPKFPYPEIARIIADRARLPVIDRGNVRRSIRSKMLGLKIGPMTISDAVEEGQIADLNRSHANVMLGLIGGLVVLMLIGLVEDFSTTAPAARSQLSSQPASGAAKPQPDKTRSSPVKPVP